MRFLVFLTLLAPCLLPAQPYAPITASQRAKFFTDDTFGVRSLLIADPAVSAWRTWRGRPVEWGKDAEGFGKRYASRIAINAITNGTEVGLGAIWKEDPRYFPKTGGTLKARLAEAARQSVLSRYADGNYHLGAAKTAGIVAGSFSQKLFVPDSVTSNRDCSIRVVGYFGARFLSNLFEEFRPEIRKIFRRK
jgi:hypothetical protein